MLFKYCMPNMSQILNCKSYDDAGKTAETDTTLRMVWEYTTRRLQPRAGLITLTKASVLDRGQISIEQSPKNHSAN